MLKFSKAAILIAVFLLMVTSGCYTKLKTTPVNLVPENEDETVIETTEEETEWDFGWGWYDPAWGYDNSYYIYYHVNWWDNCPWCDVEEEAPEIETFDTAGKVPHRDDTYVPSGVEVTTDNTVSTPSVQVKTYPSTNDSDTTKTQITKGQSTSSTSKKSDESDSENKSESKSKKKRSRR